MAALGLPVALALGAVSALVAGAVGRVLRGRRPWWSGVQGPWQDLRRLAARREAPTAVEAGGAAAALLGSGLAAAGALGAGPGSAALVYLSLAVAAVGGQVAASQPGARAADARLTAARRVAPLAEAAFVVALGVAFLRWGVADLEAVRGAHAVLGFGLGVGPAPAAAGLGLAAVTVLVASALRVPPAEAARRAPGRPAGSAVLVGASRWAATGAAAAVVAALVASGGLGRGDTAVAVPVFIGAAVASAVIGGLADGLLSGAPSAAVRAIVAGAALAVAGGAAALVWFA